LCDPVTGIMAALGGAAALFGGKKDAPAPPPAVIPATPADTARTPGADVKVGDGAAAVTASATPAYSGFTAQRITGKALGGLGRGGLGL
jgi:hypothetical protein